MYRNSYYSARGQNSNTSSNRNRDRSPPREYRNHQQQSSLTAQISSCQSIGTLEDELNKTLHNIQWPNPNVLKDLTLALKNLKFDSAGFTVVSKVQEYGGQADAFLLTAALKTCNSIDEIKKIIEYFNLNRITPNETTKKTLGLELGNVMNRNPVISFELLLYLNKGVAIAGWTIPIDIAKCSIVLKHAKLLVEVQEIMEIIHKRQLLRPQEFDHNISTSIAIMMKELETKDNSIEVFRIFEWLAGNDEHHIDLYVFQTALISCRKIAEFKWMQEYSRIKNWQGTVVSSAIGTAVGRIKLVIDALDVLHWLESKPIICNINLSVDKIHITECIKKALHLAELKVILKLAKDNNIPADEQFYNAFGVCLGNSQSAFGIYQWMCENPRESGYDLTPDINKATIMLKLCKGFKQIQYVCNSIKYLNLPYNSHTQMALYACIGNQNSMPEAIRTLSWIHSITFWAEAGNYLNLNADLLKSAVVNANNTNDIWNYEAWISENAPSFIDKLNINVELMHIIKKIPEGKIINFIDYIFSNESMKSDMTLIRHLIIKISNPLNLIYLIKRMQRDNFPITLEINNAFGIMLNEVQRSEYSNNVFYLFSVLVEFCQNKQDWRGIIDTAKCKIALQNSKNIQQLDDVINVIKSFNIDMRDHFEAAFMNLLNDSEIEFIKYLIVSLMPDHLAGLNETLDISLNFKHCCIALKKIKTYEDFLFVLSAIDLVKIESQSALDNSLAIALREMPFDEAYKIANFLQNKNTNKTFIIQTLSKTCTKSKHWNDLVVYARSVNEPLDCYAFSNLLSNAESVEEILSVDGMSITSIRAEYLNRAVLKCKTLTHLLDLISYFNELGVRAGLELSNHVGRMISLLDFTNAFNILQWVVNKNVLGQNIQPDIVKCNLVLKNCRKFSEIKQVLIFMEKYAIFPISLTLLAMIDGVKLSDFNEREEFISWLKTNPIILDYKFSLYEYVIKQMIASCKNVYEMEKTLSLLDGTILGMNEYIIAGVVNSIADSDPNEMYTIVDALLNRQLKFNNVIIELSMEMMIHAIKKLTNISTIKKLLPILKDKIQSQSEINYYLSTAIFNQENINDSFALVEFALKEKYSLGISVYEFLLCQCKSTADFERFISFFNNSSLFFGDPLQILFSNFILQLKTTNDVLTALALSKKINVKLPHLRNEDVLSVDEDYLRDYLFSHIKNIECFTQLMKYAEEKNWNLSQKEKDKIFDAITGFSLDEFSNALDILTPYISKIGENALIHMFARLIYLQKSIMYITKIIDKLSRTPNLISKEHYQAFLIFIKNQSNPESILTLVQHLVNNQSWIRTPEHKNEFFKLWNIAINQLFFIDNNFPRQSDELMKILINCSLNNKEVIIYQTSDLSEDNERGRKNLDLHGYTYIAAVLILDRFMNEHTHAPAIRIITGKGNHSNRDSLNQPLYRMKEHIYNHIKKRINENDSAYDKLDFYRLTSSTAGDGHIDLCTVRWAQTDTLNNRYTHH